MIRSIFAFLATVSSLIAISFGAHPVWFVGAAIISAILVGWVCVNKFEDQPQLG